MSPGLKLTAGALLVAAAIGYLAYLGAASSWQYYLRSTKQWPTRHT